MVEWNTNAVRSNRDDGNALKYGVECVACLCRRAMSAREPRKSQSEYAATEFRHRDGVSDTAAITHQRILASARLVPIVGFEVLRYDAPVARQCLARDTRAT